MIGVKATLPAVYLAIDELVDSAAYAKLDADTCRFWFGGFYRGSQGSS
jgi:hypothetical protein